MNATPVRTQLLGVGLQRFDKLPGHLAYRVAVVGLVRFRKTQHADFRPTEAQISDEVFDKRQARLHRSHVQCPRSVV